MEDRKQCNPVALAALDSVLTSEKWRQTCGLDEWTMYGELAMEVAMVAIAAEREACAKIADGTPDDEFPGEVWIASKIAAAIRARGE